jgi:hypothetical protein
MHTSTNVNDEEAFAAEAKEIRKGLLLGLRRRLQHPG